jgi:hypothetical protein
MPSSGVRRHADPLQTDVLPKRLFTQDLYGATSQKTAVFIVTAVETSNLTQKLQVPENELFGKCRKGWTMCVSFITAIIISFSANQSCFKVQIFKIRSYRQRDSNVALTPPFALLQRIWVKYSSLIRSMFHLTYWNIHESVKEKAFSITSSKKNASTKAKLSVSLLYCSFALLVIILWQIVIFVFLVFCISSLLLCIPSSFPLGILFALQTQHRAKTMPSFPCHRKFSKLSPSKPSQQTFLLPR